MLSSHLILGRPLLLLPPIPPSIRVFTNESTLRMRWLKYWSFSFSIIPSKEHPGLISFRRDWLDLLAVQGTLKSLLQHRSSKASILQRSAFFTVQLSHPYMTTGTMSQSNWRARSVRNTGLIILAGSYCVLGQISRPKYSRGEALKNRCSDVHGAVTAQVMVIFVGEQDGAGSPHSNRTWNLESGPNAEVMLQD